MLNKEEILHYLSVQKEEFAECYQITKLGLFGSFAKEEQSEHSDIDLIVEFAPKTEHLSEKKAAIKSIIKSKFNRNVDLCREKYIKPYYRTQILQSTIYV